MPEERELFNHFTLKIHNREIVYTCDLCPRDRATQSPITRKLGDIYEQCRLHWKYNHA